VFLIDGRRGAGKTYTLLSVEYALGQFAQYLADDHFNKEWQTPFDLVMQVASEKAPSACTPEQMRAALSTRVPAQTIKIIFPGDLLVNESLMEFLFARLGQRIRESIRELESQNPFRRADPDIGAANQERLQALKNLQDRLQNDVEQGWYFANRFGLDALVRDSSDYRDLVMRWGEESNKAAQRIDTWRSFINAYLDFYNTETLVVLVDDSDVRQELTEDILHSIRMFLNHPRIVTVLAGNLKSMRDTLLYRSLERVRSATQALNKSDHPAAREWRRRERQTIEEYLEKVLPPAQRIHVSRPTVATEDRDTGNNDFEKIAHQSLPAYLQKAMLITRRDFLDAKFKLALAREFQRVDAPTQPERARIENFLAWWVFANMYRDQLAPQSARQIKTFRDFYYSWFGPRATLGGGSTDGRGSSKRLPVMLFDNAANFTLIQRLTDEDPSLSDWLRRQPLSSSWSGRRCFSIDGREVHDGSYTYHYLRYRLDVGLGMPVRDNSDEVVPMDLLPKPVGRRFMRRFFQPRQMARRHRRIGVSRWLEHASIPGNCIYFRDLQSLPDVSFLAAGELDARDRLQSGDWEAQLADRWHELIEDRHETAEDEYLLRYFCEIVCESLQHTEQLSSAALIGELDPPDILEKQTRAIYEHFVADELGMFAAHRWERRTIWLRAQGPEGNPAIASALERSDRLATAKDPVSKKEPMATAAARRVDAGLQFPPASPLRMIALYTAMITDLRRAWHAIRIYEGSPTQMGGSQQQSVRDFDQRASLAVIANRDRMKLYRRKNVENLIKLTEWGARIYDVFAPDNVDAAVSNFFQTQRKGQASQRAKVKLDSASIRALYEVTQGGQILSEDQIRGEDTDFERWTDTLRSLGRSFCKNWPVHDLRVSREIIGLEDELFESDMRWGGEAGAARLSYVMLKIFDERSEKRGERDKDPADGDLRRANTRSARNLIWLLYGLAPSLPAVIHADIMSRIYEAELRQRLLHDLEAAAESERVYYRDAKRRETLRDTIDELYDEAIDEIKKWGEMVGRLAVLTRYIKIKCLHLDTALFLQATLDATRAGDNTTGFQLFEHCGYAVKGVAGSQADLNQVGESFVELLRGRRDASRGEWNGFGCDLISEGLAVFPDVSPSTLFGDQWVRDILSRQGISREICDRLAERTKLEIVAPKQPGLTSEGLSVNGVFGETEQWLWSANRTLRKLLAVLEGRRKKVGGAAQSPPARSRTPKRSRKRVKGASG